MFHVEFPGLGLGFTLNRVAFSVFGIDIYWYGICIGVGMMLALAYAFSQSKRFGVNADRMIDVVLVGLVCAIIGGRLYYVFFVDGRAENYKTFWDVINLRSGGIAIYGGIIGAFLGGWLACKWRRVPVLPLFDLAGQGFLIGQACGRWGNFFNQEAFGRNTALAWGMYSEGTHEYLLAHQASLAADGVVVNPALPVHPTFLYESLWCIVGFVLLFLYRKHRKFNGEMFLMYIFWYGVGRFWIEGLRTDSLMTNGGLRLRVSQVLAIASALVALVLWVGIRIKKRGQPLQVPQLGMHTAKVRVQGPNGPAMVQISWPAGERAPRKEERYKMALDKLENPQETPPKEAEKSGENQPDATAAPARKEEAAKPAEAAAEEAEKTQEQDDRQGV